MNYKDLPKCPIETTLKMLGCKWKVLIIRDLLTGTKRFCELKKSVKVVFCRRIWYNGKKM